MLQYVYGVIHIKIENLFDLKNGYTPSTSKSEFWDNGDIPWFKMEDIRENGNILNDSITHITNKAIKGGLFKKNSIIISTSATIGEHALITTDFLCNQRFTCLTTKENLNEFVDPKFIYHYAFLIDEWCKSNTTTSSFASVDMNAFRKYEINLPSIKKQREIVLILDEFYKMISDLSEGLPAEIEARKKQYEYYRNKLLNFE